MPDRSRSPCLTLKSSDGFSFLQVFVTKYVGPDGLHDTALAILDEIHLAVPEGIERARIDIEIAFQLDGRNGESLVFQALGEQRLILLLSKTMGLPLKA
jgi:hypothetical protein